MTATVSLRPIGYVRGGRKEPINDDWDSVTATIELDTDWLGADAIRGLDSFSHAVILFRFHVTDPATVVTGARHPRNNPDLPLTGIFAQRGHYRPNLIGSTVCRVLGVEGTGVRVQGLDAIDGTPVIDIKPYMTAFAPRGGIFEPEWVEDVMSRYWKKNQTNIMTFQDYRSDARRVYETLLAGGIGIVPTDVGYVILGVTAEAIWKIFRVKRRKPEKLNAMCGCLEMHRDLHVLEDERRAVVSAIIGDANLPMGTVARGRLDHPALASLEKDVLDQTTDEGTVAMLLNAGPLLDELARVAFADNRLVIGSSANISLRGVKFRADDIEPEIREAADIVIDYGLSRWNRYGKSSTMIDVGRMRVVRYGSCFDLIDDLLKRRFDISLPPDPSA